MSGREGESRVVVVREEERDRSGKGTGAGAGGGDDEIEEEHWQCEPCLILKKHTTERVSEVETAKVLLRRHRGGPPLSLT